MDTINEGSSSFSHEEILEQLRKIQEQEDKMYGTQTSLPLGSYPKDSKLPIDEGFDSEIESLADNSEDPALCKKLYYRIMTLVNSSIPKGKIRDFVHNEKKLYLKCTSKTSDSRFSFKNSLNTLFDILDDWQRTDSNGYDLGLLFYELNEKEGFHKTQVIKAAQSPFDTKLKALLNTPPPAKGDKIKKEGE